MLHLVRSIPDQLEYSWNNAGPIVEKLSCDAPSMLVVGGMGGSGVSGDLLKGLLMHASQIPIEVVKDYTLPGWVTEDSFAVLISYSGNTEETLALWESARSRGLPVLAITSGGKLKELAELSRVPVVTVPSGNPPRASVGYLFAPILRLVQHWGIYPEAQKELFAATSLVRSRVYEWEEEMQDIAKSLVDKFPVIHSLDLQFAPLGYRLSCQLNENSKILAHSHVYPEMNHNEIVGFEGSLEADVVLILLDPGEGFTNPRNAQRERIVNNILPSSVSRVRIEAEGESLLERLITVLVKGDLLSVFLALIRGIDPLPVNSIERLKRELG